MTSFDLIVIGSGSAGSAVAGRCRRAGWRVAMIDERPFGGTCALRGCDPKKVLIGIADVVDATRRLRGRGIEGEAQVDWPSLMAFKRSFTDPYPAQKERGLRDAGIEIVHGPARFSGRSTVSVENRTLQARYFVIATGAKPALMGFPGAELLATSDDFLDLPTLPQRIVFVGGGYISFEFAHVAARAGSTVTILHRGEQPLHEFDRDLVETLIRHSAEIGINVRTNMEVTGVERVGDSFAVRGMTDGRPEQFACDLVVHGAGRRPAVADLEPMAAGISYTDRGVDVNEYLQSTSNPAVFAAGDAAARGPALTPVAGYDGRVVADNLLNGLSERADYSGVASVVFTIPPLASVGLLEPDARRLGLDFDVHSGDMSNWYSSRRLGERAAGYKTIVERNSGRILGAHLLGPHASETINIFALALRTGITVRQLKESFFAYPTGASDVQYML